MSLFPRIAHPCPYIDRLGEVMEGDVCRMCKRQVYDLTDMNDGDRAAFLAACGGDACVSYVAMVRPAIAAALVAASAAALIAPDPALARKSKSRAVAVSLPVVPVMLAGAPLPIEPPAPPPAPSPPTTPSSR